MSDTRNYQLVYPDPGTNEEESSGGYVEVHITHHSHEYVQNLGTAIILARQGFRVRLLPIDDTPHAKNPDAYFSDENIRVEFKQNYTPTRSAIEEAIRKGRYQADYIVIHILSDVSADDIIRGIINRMYYAKNVQRLWLIYNDEIITLTRDEIFDGTIRLKIK